MKRRITMIGLSILLCIATLSGEWCTLTTFAGQKDVVVGKSSFANELNTNLWNNPEDDVAVKNGTLVFTSDSTEETRLITTASAQVNKRLTEMFHASITMKFTSLPANEKFAFAFGLSSIEAYQGDNGNVEIAFSNQNGLMVEVTVYTEGGTQNVIVAPTKCGTMNSNVTVEVALLSGGKLDLKVGGKTLCKATELSVAGEGNLGFVQTGNCAAVISDINLIVRQYDAPQNTDIEENFDNGYMNTGVFASKTIYTSKWYPQSLSVQEYKGNNVLMFERCGLAYVGTRHQYSNFELTFDVPFMQRAQERDEDGKIVTPVNENFLVSFGGDAVDYKNYGYDEAADCIIFNANSHITNRRRQFEGYDDNYMIFSKDYPKDKGFSVKVSVIDGIVTVGLKWLEEQKFTTVLTYKLEGGTPTGYVHIWTTVVGNMAVDNIKLLNKDKEPELIEVEYKNEPFDRIPDFPYKKAELVFRKNGEQVGTDDGQNVTGADQKIQWYHLLVGTAIVGVVILSGGFVTGQILKRKKNKQIGGKQDEA